MNFRFPLPAQILCLVVLNVLSLVAIRFLFFSPQLSSGWNSIICDSAAERVHAIAFSTFRQMLMLPDSEWSGLLKEYEEMYGAKFLIFDEHGKQVAGEKLKIPNEVSGKLETPLPKPHFFGLTGRHLPLFHVQALDSKGAAVLSPGVIRNGKAPLRTFTFTVARPFESSTVPEFGHVPPPEFVRVPPPPEFEAPPPEFQGLPAHGIESPAPPFTGRTMFIKLKSFLFGSDIAQPGIRVGAFPGIRRHFIAEHLRFFVQMRNPDRLFIGVRIPLNLKGEHQLGTLLAVTPNIWQTGLISDVRDFFIIGCLVIAGTIVVSLLIWWPFIFRVTNALGKFTKATEKIADGKFETRLAFKSRDEIGWLAAGINTMAQRLNAFVTGQKRFLGDIAHELSSPVARLQVSLELLERECSHAQKPHIDDMREEVEQMTSLINELLAFSKAGLRGKDTPLVRVDVAALIDKAAAKKCPSDMRIEIDLQPQLFCLGDQTLLERALSNVLRNAARYAKDYGPVSICAVKKGDDVVITVRDSGPGVPSEAIEMLGQPFYRPESSRSRSLGGVGLGLAIVKSCVETCNGSFVARPGEVGGLEIEIRLPASA